MYMYMYIQYIHIRGYGGFACGYVRIIQGYVGVTNGILSGILVHTPSSHTCLGFLKSEVRCCLW